MKGPLAYALICEKAGREQDLMELLAWSMLGVEPEWFKELTKETL